MPEAIFVPNFLSLELPNAELPNLELPNAEVPNVEAPMRLPTPLYETSEQLENARTRRRFITPEQLENIRTVRRFEGARLQPCRQSNKMIEGFSP